VIANDLFRDSPGNRNRVHRRIAVIGAGPFGLALAAKLQAANVDYVLLGRVMSFWQNHVPAGTCLLSERAGCSLSYDGFDSSAYERSRGNPLPSHLPAEEFVAYGLWFQRNTCANSDQRLVVSLTRINGTYRIGVEDGDEITADHVVVAIGLEVFAFRPPEFATVSPGTVSHTSELRDLSGFRAKRVAIIGSGQSALEYAALMTENGARVEVVARANRLFWRRMGHPRQYSVDTNWSMRETIRRALNDPDLYRRLPKWVRTFWFDRTLRPVVCSDLQPRLTSVRLSLGRKVTAAHMKGNRVELELDDHSPRCVDHVVLGTGYRMDINAIPFLAPELRHQIRQYDGYPELNSGMESTVPQLYFTGAAAARAFGPNMWFLYGAPWAAIRIASLFRPRRSLSSAKNGGFDSIPGAPGHESSPSELRAK
jgi:cation diffusion facilitator CzcD-associated flavoprotein CzcO